MLIFPGDGTLNTETISITPEQARRLFIFKQHLVGNSKEGNFGESLISIIRDICYIQWDPVTVVAPSHFISMWSRMGIFNWSHLEELMWKSREIFLHWTPIAYLVLTEDYPIFYSLMKEYPESLGSSWRNHIPRAQNFLDSHKELKGQVLEKLIKGPASIREFRYYGDRRKSEDGWSTGNDVSTLLYHLHMLGEVMVSGHESNQNVWSLTEEFLPAWANRKHLPMEDLERQTVIRGLKAMGAGTELDINRYFVRGRYRKLKETLKTMKEESTLLKVQVEGQSQSRPYYMLQEDVSVLDRLDSLEWDSNIRLISPFDNLISIRERTKRLVNFDYILEQFVPKERRKYGTYVLPILWKDKLVGRLDAKLDKPQKRLKINSVYSEPGFETEDSLPGELRAKIQEFSIFLGAEDFVISQNVPNSWKKQLL